MERRSVLTMGAVGAAAILAGGVATAAPALADTGKRGPKPVGSGDPQSLRALGAAINLPIGSALTPDDITKWGSISGGQFSVVTGANAMKWQTVEPNTQGTYDWTDADQLVAFARANHQLVRGHTLLWHNQLPTWLTDGVAAGTITKTQLWSLLEKHIFTELGRYKGKIWQWDVANEFFTDADPSGIDPNNWWVANAGADIIPQAFKWAHQADPNALLFYNDYNITGEDGTNAKSDAVFAWVRQQRDAGVPIHGVGTQAHLDTQYGFDPQRFQSDLERYASIGLKIAITEADVRTFVDGPDTQVPTDSLAQFAQPFEYAAMLSAAVSVPQVISFTVWGWTDSDSWVPSTFSGEGYACIYDVNQQPKQAYYSLQKVLELASAGPTHRAAPPRA
ncbi:endo-1,4-beta-xylanase [Gryllotalpicola protaetiae]|uniref:Beta-xylanase n=1 Tax=Gryllotalpicola protaetiae TaxID=2419771 RepID=A0A387BJZ9_9MICO|nr:endo-1,4-beta-xylanase [Gryllotalpicola protaetiae]AYG02494.1 1,4-beta-xylanase [Gryllotalpicola protaetiae]